MNGFRITPGIKKILIANIVVFAVQQVFPQIIYYFALYWAGLVNNFFVWTPITYMFLHGGFGHIFFNMFALWIFGTELESKFGTDRFYLLYFLGGFIGGMLHLAISGLIPTIGASAGVMAIVVAYGFTFPNRIIYLNFFIPVKAIWLAIGYVALDLIGAFSSTGGGIAHLAHLGGALVGFLFTRSKTKFGKLSNFFRNIPKIIKVEKVNKKPSKRKKPGFTVHEGSSDNEKATYYQKKVDEILDKINEVGYLNLSDDDRELLDRGSKFLREYHRRHGN